MSFLSKLFTKVEEVDIKGTVVSLKGLTMMDMEELVQQEEEVVNSLMNGGFSVKALMKHSPLLVSLMLFKSIQSPEGGEGVTLDEVKKLSVGAQALLLEAVFSATFPSAEDTERLMGKLIMGMESITYTLGTSNQTSGKSNTSESATG